MDVNIWIFVNGKRSIEIQRKKYEKTVSELQAKLGSRQLPTTGLKADLIMRLLHGHIENDGPTCQDNDDMLVLTNVDDDEDGGEGGVPSIVSLFQDGLEVQCEEEGGGGGGCGGRDDDWWCC
eukprot:15366673-Ditylum_brightwellii.AAC.2